MLVLCSSARCRCCHLQGPGTSCAASLPPPRLCRRCETDADSVRVHAGLPEACALHNPPASHTPQSFGGRQLVAVLPGLRAVDVGKRACQDRGPGEAHPPLVRNLSFSISTIRLGLQPQFRTSWVTISVIPSKATLTGPLNSVISTSSTSAGVSTPSSTKACIQ